MADHERMPTFIPSDTVDPLGGYLLRSFDSSTGYKLATYEWTPSCGTSSARGIVFLLHGILGHTAFEWLSPDGSNHRVLLRDSIVERLLNLDLIVIGHDHPSHGRSSGLHCYFESHDELRDASIDIITHYSEKYPNLRKLLIGMSMGGTTAVRVCEKMPSLIDCYVLLSPAVRPPDDMFGWQGQLLKFISPILAATVPKLPVLSLPKSPDAVIRDATEKDGLIYKGAIRVRLGVEFLRVYSEINDRAHLLHFKTVGIFIGLNDQIVSPTGMREFVNRINSDDKHLFEFEQFGHDIFREKGTEIVIDNLISFIESYVDKHV